MREVDLNRLAQQFVITNRDFGPGSRLLISYRGPDSQPLVDAMARAARAAGGEVVLENNWHRTFNRVYGGMSVEDLEQVGREKLAEMQSMTHWIGIRDVNDSKKIWLSENPDRDDEDAKAESSNQFNLYVKHVQKPAQDHRVNHLKWLLVAAPTESAAAENGMSMSDYETHYLNTNLLDYGQMTAAVKRLKELMDNAKEVRIIQGDDTDLTFSIEGLGAVPCTGEHNIPDGECYTAPVRDSINGRVKFGRTAFNGEEFESVKLVIENGKIIEAEAENEERTTALNRILDADEGTRYAGEWSMNFNPYIWDLIGDTLPDEKARGGWHMAWGAAYEDGPADNGNRSQNHWDMVQLQTPEHGGGEIWIDGVLIRKDGMFMLPELQGLNPDALIAATQAVLEPAP